MEGPSEPGYYASVTGVRPAGEKPGRPKPGEPLRGPVALYGQVYRCGPRQARKTYVLRVILGLRLPDVERVWKGPDHRVRPLTPDSLGEHMRISEVCMDAAQAEAARLNRLDPRAIGLG